MNNRLKQLRKALGLKQREIEERIGAKGGLVGRWESGLQPIPKTRIYQICKEYNVRRAWLETGVGEMFEQSEEKQSEEEAQVKFCREIFDSMPTELQEVVIKALKERVEKNEQTPTAAQEEEPPRFDAYGAPNIVAQILPEEMRRQQEEGNA